MRAQLYQPQESQLPGSSPVVWQQKSRQLLGPAMQSLTTLHHRHAHVLHPCLPNLGSCKSCS